MSPIEIFIDGKSAGKTGTGPSEIRLPKPPGGTVEWYGDGSGFGQMIAGPDNLCEVFQLIEENEEVKHEVPDLSAELFKNAGNTKTEVIIKRISSKHKAE